MKIKLNIDEWSSAILKHFFSHINASKTVTPGLEVEHLVLIHWSKNNFWKTQIEKTYKATMLPHEAISLRRMLFRIGLSDETAAITRDMLCEQIAQQLPPEQSRLNQPIYQ